MASESQPLVGDLCNHADTCVGPDGTIYILASKETVAAKDIDDMTLLKFVPSTGESTTIVSSFITNYSKQFPGFCKFGLGASVALVGTTLYCFVPIQTSEDCGHAQEYTCLYLIQVAL